ncbi:MAG: AraC family transcriptional regulator [Limisphaerales bacterium]
MNTKLNRIQNWLELARQAKWSAAALAKQCGVSVRTLERYFLKKFNKSPRLWLAEHRQKQAIELLHDGSTVKETANYLDYKTQHHFSREFKKNSGYPPSQFVIPGPT